MASCDVDLEIAALSREYVRVPIQAYEDGAAVDPTGDTVVMAFTALTAQPASGDWKAASWETDATTDPDTYYARTEIGPGSTVGALAAGDYFVWVKITDSPEVPVKRAGTLRVF